MLKAYEALLAQATPAWQAVERPQRTLVRVPIATCSLPGGAAEVLEVLRTQVRERGLAIDVAQVGETGLCWLEPLVEVRRPGGSACPNRA